jgi:hypothetical protein
MNVNNVFVTSITYIGDKNGQNVGGLIDEALI